MDGNHCRVDFMTGQPTPNEPPPRTSRPYDQGLLTIGFRWQGLVKLLFLGGGGTLGGGSLPGHDN